MLWLWYFYNCVQHVLWSLCSHGLNMLYFNVIYLIECQIKKKEISTFDKSSLCYVFALYLECIVLLHLRFKIGLSSKYVHCCESAYLKYQQTIIYEWIAVRPDFL